VEFINPKTLRIPGLFYLYI